jgi:LCP family protein required for cell wall assembly
MDDQADPEGSELHARGHGPAKRRTARRVLLAVLLAVALAASAYAVSLIRTGPAAPQPTPTASAAAVAEPTPPPATTAPPTPAPPKAPVLPLNILLLGSDSRADFRQEEAQAEAGTPSDQRSDVMILIHIPAGGKPVYGISIMRDLWVDIPGYGGSKVNAALGLGGMPLAVKTAESLLGVPIQHVVMTDFEGFKGLTDALGGVPVNVNVPFTATHGAGHVFTPGVNQLDGAAALDFVRERYAFSDGDFQRVRNQQAFLRAVVVKAMSAGTLNNPETAGKVISALKPFLKVDSAFSPEELLSLAYGLRAAGTEPVFFTLPTAGFGTSSDGQSVVVADPAAIAGVSAALAADDLAGFVAAHNLQNGN